MHERVHTQIFFLKNKTNPQSFLCIPEEIPDIGKKKKKKKLFLKIYKA